MLRRADPARLLVRLKHRVRPLAPQQLRAVLAFQNDDPYDASWLKAHGSAPHFRGGDGRRLYLVELYAPK